MRDAISPARLAFSLLLGRQARRTRPSPFYLSLLLGQQARRTHPARLTFSPLLGQQARRTWPSPSHLEPLTGITSATRSAQPVSPSSPEWDKRRDAFGPARFFLSLLLGQQARCVRPSPAHLEPLKGTTSTTHFTLGPLLEPHRRDALGQLVSP